MDTNDPRSASEMTLVGSGNRTKESWLLLCLQDQVKLSSLNNLEKVTSPPLFPNLGTCEGD